MHPAAGYGMTFELYDSDGNELGTLFVSSNTTFFSGTVKFIQSNGGKVYGEDKVFKCEPEVELDNESESFDAGYYNGIQRVPETEQEEDNYPTIDPEHYM